MAIAFISASSNNDVANDDIVVTAPASILDDDLLLGWYAGYGAPTTSALSITLAGFARLTEKFETGGTDHSMAIFTKIASGEAGNYTFTGSHPGTPQTAAGMIVLRGVDSAIWDVTFVEGTHYVINQNFGADDLTQPANITTAADGAMCVIFSWIGFNNTTNIVPPTGFDERFEVLANNSNIHCCTKIQTTAGAVNPGTIEGTNAGATADASHYTLAIKPAASGPSAHQMQAYQGMERMNGGFRR